MLSDTKNFLIRMKGNKCRTNFDPKKATVLKTTELSLLPQIGKIFEHIIYNTMFPYLLDNKLN